jgi:hypothetical protein
MRDYIGRCAKAFSRFQVSGSRGAGLDRDGRFDHCPLMAHTGPTDQHRPGAAGVEGQGIQGQQRTDWYSRLPGLALRGHSGITAITMRMRKALTLEPEFLHSLLRGSDDYQEARVDNRRPESIW